MTSHVPQLRTAGVLADEVDAPLSRVLYVLRKLNIKPIGRAGVLRLYDRDSCRVGVRRTTVHGRTPGGRTMTFTVKQLQER